MYLLPSTAHPPPGPHWATRWPHPQRHSHGPNRPPSVQDWRALERAPGPAGTLLALRRAGGALGSGLAACVRNSRGAACHLPVAQVPEASNIGLRSIIGNSQKCSTNGLWAISGARHLRRSWKPRGAMLSLRGGAGWSGRVLALADSSWEMVGGPRRLSRLSRCADVSRHARAHRRPPSLATGLEPVSRPTALLAVIRLARGGARARGLRGFCLPPSLASRPGAGAGRQCAQRSAGDRRGGAHCAAASARQRSGLRPLSPGRWFSPALGGPPASRRSARSKASPPQFARLLAPLRARAMSRRAGLPLRRSRTRRGPFFQIRTRGQRSTWSQKRAP